MPATNERRLNEKCARQALLAVPLVMRFMREQMRRHRQQGLTVPQFRALIFVHHFPEAGLSPMAEHIGLSLPAASRMVDALVRRALLLRTVDPLDRRCVRLALTPRGQSVYRRAHRATQSALANRLSSISRRELKVAIQALEMLERTFGRVSGVKATAETKKPRARRKRVG